MEDVHYFLGMKVERNRERRELMLSQRSYVNKMAATFAMENAASITPIRADIKLIKASPERMDKCNKPYRELVGSLMYLACTTRPDIMYAASYLARYLSCYDDQHWTEAKRALRYVIATKTYTLQFGNEDNGIVGYCDADWAGDADERKSTSGYVYMYNGAAFTWSSKRQSVVAASSVEAEYIALSRCVRQALWIRKLMHDFGMSVPPITIHVDNTGAISLSHDDKMNAATKHIDVAYHLTRDYVIKEWVKIVYVASVEMVADGLTKALRREKIESNRKMLGLTKHVGANGGAK